MTDQDPPDGLAALDARTVSIVLPGWLVPFRDRGVRAIALLVGLAVVAGVMFGLAWRGTARTYYVPLQMPWLVSGGLMAIGLLGLALGAWSIHLSRRQDAAYRAAVDEFVREAAELAEDLRTGRKSFPSRPKRRTRR
ncbi:MAG TPA: hypothetical protein VG899_15365 [Mycobacteriales bacterium]|nr:hypothetical protein [Mycobacteriales bacterium]